MRLYKKNILLVSPEPWDHIFVSKHHYGVYLAKRGNRVFFLNPPSERSSVEDTGYTNLFCVHYTGFPKGLRFFPAVVRHALVRNVFKSLQTLCSVRFDVIWSFDNSVFFDFKALPHEVIKISHIVDLNQNFQTKIATSTANYCFCTTDLIMARLQKFTANVTKISHGCHLPASPLDTRDDLPAGTRVVYSGNLAMPFIDWLVVRELVTKHKIVNFLFIGPGVDALPFDVEQAKAKEEVLQCDNTTIVHKVDSDLLQAYYRSADLLILSYREEFHAEQANPHKMMEYLASGKMIICTYTAEYVQLRTKGLILMSERNADLPGLFASGLSDLRFWNSDALERKRKSYALDHTYDKQIEKIERIIKNW